MQANGTLTSERSSEATDLRGSRVCVCRSYFKYSNIFYSTICFSRRYTLQLDGIKKVKNIIIDEASDSHWPALSPPPLLMPQELLGLSSTSLPSLVLENFSVSFHLFMKIWGPWNRISTTPGPCPPEVSLIFEEPFAFFATITGLIPAYSPSKTSKDHRGHPLSCHSQRFHWWLLS